MNAWSNLPNADHIDWVLASLTNDSHKWKMAVEFTYKLNIIEDYDVFYTVAWNEAANKGRIEQWEESQFTAISILKEQSLASQTFWVSAGWYALAALVAYDDVKLYLEMSYDQLAVWAKVSQKPQALLLLAMKWVQENE